MKNKTCIRIISYMLAVIMLIHTLMVEAMPVSADQESSVDMQQDELITEDSDIEREEKSLTVSFGNGEVSQYDIMIDANDKYMLYAEEQSAVAEYQWQIRHKADDSLWINIYDKTSAQCEVSYSLVEDMLDANQQVYLRCVAIVDGIEQLSIPVVVSYSEVLLEAKKQDANETEEGVLSYTKVAENYMADPEYVTVTIKYVDKDTQAQVFDDYVATLHYGSDFQAEVPSPTRLGYKPFALIDGVYQSMDKYVINLTGIVSDVTYKVEYDAVEVTYSARHYIQNVSDNQYSEYRVVTGTAKTGTEPSTESLSLTELIGNDATADQYGFTSLYHEPDVVAADGSTEFHVYYDRKYYLYNFELDGGYGVDPIYARYETPIVAGTPEKPGYTFAGWQKKNAGDTYTDVDKIDSKVGVGDVTYKAKWTEINNGTKYKVVWWLEDPDYKPDPSDSDAPQIKYNHWYDKTFSGTANNTVNGESFKTHNEVQLLKEYKYAIYDSASTEVIKGDSTTVVNVYYKRKEYTLKFYYARSTRTGDNVIYEVAGGSTHNFANTVSNNVGTLLGAVNDKQWGEVKLLPGLNKDGSAKGYQLGQDTFDDKTYYYISFNAKYDANISNIFPVAVFDPVLMNEDVYYGDYGYFSAWTAQNGTVYGSHTGDDGLFNPTVKGNYQYLDKDLLWADNRTSTTIHFLAFWENAVVLENNKTWNMPHKWTYKLFVPMLSTDDASEKSHSYNGVDYKLYGTYSLYDDAGIGGQTTIQLRGYTPIEKKQQLDETEIINTYYVNSVQKDVCSYVAHFYYERMENSLTFSNNGVSGEAIQVEYGTPLKDRYYVPSYPTTLEPNTHEFAGWYTSATFVEETKIDWDTFTMPENPVLLYACWKPIERTVTFSNHYKDLQKEVYLDVSQYGGMVPHGSYIPEGKIPSYEDVSADGLGTAEYKPIGWFYIDAITGTKTRFNPGSMPITQDIHLFMEWESNKAVPYKIRYVTVKDGVEIEIAPPMTGYSFAGLTRTFSAKTETQLNSGYQKKYYPNVGSHSILMTEEIINGETTNTYTFEYVYKEKVNYVVNYYDESTMLLMETITQNPKNGDNGEKGESVITEKFVSVSEYIPDAFYKRLILSADDSKNIINFYYKKDTVHAYYVVHHMIESTSAVSGGTQQYEEYSMIQGVGDIDKTVSEKVLTIGGYTYDKALTQKEAGTFYNVGDDAVSGKVTSTGLEMYVYYSRNKSGYKKRYREWGADDSVPDLHEVITVDGKYGDVIDIDLSNDWIQGNEYHDHTLFESDGIKYELISDETYNSTMGIVELNDDGTVKTYPEIIFYYKAKKVSISYEAVCKTATSGFGYVSVASENVATATNLSGCTPMATTGYEFVGWYTDKACTTPVNATWVGADNKLKLTTLPANNTTYYALFKATAGSLIIQNQGNSIKTTDTFVYHIQGIDGVAASIDLYVSITGSGSVKVLEVPVGAYTITQLTDWSWRYVTAPSENKCEISAGETETVSFENTYQNTKWFGSESKRDKILS